MPAITDYSHLVTNPDDWRPAFDAALAAIPAGWGGSIGFPGRFEFGGPLTVPRSGIKLDGDGPFASAIVNTQAAGPAIIIGGNGQLVEKVAIRGLDVLHSVTRAPGEASIVIDRASRTDLDDVEIRGCATGVAYGTQANPGAQNVIAKLRNVRVNSTNFGVLAWGGNMLELDGCQFNFVGQPYSGGAGLRVIGSLDGLYVGGMTKFEECDFGVFLSPTSGSLANVFMQSFCIDRPRMCGVRLESYAGSVINGAEISGTVYCTEGQADAFALYAGADWGIRDVKLRATGRQVRRRLLTMSGRQLGITIDNPTSWDGSRESPGNYPMLDLGGAQHDRVTLVGGQQTGHSAGLVGHGNTSRFSQIGSIAA